jgi:hypothetical protein
MPEHRGSWKRTRRAALLAIGTLALLPAAPAAGRQLPQAPTQHPGPNVSVSYYSTAVHGNLMEAVGGVSAEVTLSREDNGSPREIATATATSNGSGLWRATLTKPAGVAGLVSGVSAGDLLSVHYVPPYPGVPVPPDFSGVVAAPVSVQISADGTSALMGPLYALYDPYLRVDGHAVNATSCDGLGCHFTLSPPVTDASEVQGVDRSTPFTTAQAGLLGASAPPTCNADRVTRVVSCGPLNAGSFTVSVDGGAPVPLTSSMVGNAIEGTATIASLKAGDRVTLEEASPTPTTRPLTTLHVGILRLDVDGSGVSGICQPNQQIQPPASGVLCSAAGVYPTAVNGGTTERDDRSGGSTSVSIPSLTNLIPAQDASLASGTFTAYADISATAGTSAQVLAETKSVRLTIRPHGSTKLVVNELMTLTSDSDSAYAYAPVTSLPAGRYYADWELTDINGDHHSGYETLFAVQ